MQVWNMLHAENIGRKNSPSAHHRTTLSGYIFATQARIDNRKKLIKQQYLVHMSLRPPSGWDPLASLGHPCKFQRVSRLGSVTARHSSSGRQPNFVALNRGRHLYLTGRPSRWALAHICSWLLYWNFLLVSVHTQTDRWKLVSGRENFSCCRSACVRLMKWYIYYQSLL